jgi:hypothetical protein
VNTRITVAAAIAAATIALGLPARAHAQSAGAYQAADCPTLISQTESRRNIPRGLLMAIAMTESGLNGRPDPYAMNIAGRGYHANGFQDMNNVISANWQRGVKSIDVGCMQINLKFHGDKFAHMTDLIDPTTNVNYGASFLINLATQEGSWKDAVMSYHNRTNPSRRAWYGCKVWNNYLRITGAQTGYVACASAPGGSSTAAVGSTTPIRLAGYNVQRGAGPLTPPSQIPGGDPVESGQQVAMVGSRAVDIAIPTTRTRGSMTIVGAGDSMPDVVENDGRASAFKAIRPVNWAGRVQRSAPASGSQTPTVQADDVDAGQPAQSGFGRVTRSSR